MLEDNEPPSIVRNIMAKPVITIERGGSVLEAAKIMSEKNIGSIVVVDRGNPVGIVTERDILQKVVSKGLDASNVKMEEIMTKNPIAIKGDTPIIKAIRILEKKKVRRLLVMDRGKLVGIVTQRDLLRALAFHVIISFRPLI